MKKLFWTILLVSLFCATAQAQDYLAGSFSANGTGKPTAAAAHDTSTWKANACWDVSSGTATGCFRGVTSGSGLRGFLYDYYGLTIQGNQASVTGVIPTPLSGTANDASIYLLAPATGTGDIADFYDKTGISLLARIESDATTVLPALSLTTTPLAISSGGTGGTTTPTLSAGTGLTISGSWPSFTAGITNTAVTPASYTHSSITVNQQGQITAASSGTTFGVTCLSGGTTTFSSNTNGSVNVQGWFAPTGLHITQFQIGLTAAVMGSCSPAPIASLAINGFNQASSATTLSNSSASWETTGLSLAVPANQEVTAGLTTGGVSCSPTTGLLNFCFAYTIP